VTASGRFLPDVYVARLLTWKDIQSWPNLNFATEPIPVASDRILEKIQLVVGAASVGIRSDIGK
jgi:hypothetical protein